MDCWLDPKGKEAEGWLSPVMTEHLFKRDPPQLPNWPIFKKARGAYFHFEPSQGFSDNVFFSRGGGKNTWVLIIEAKCVSRVTFKFQNLTVIYCQ
jgi:hypothetical protein